MQTRPARMAGVKLWAANAEGGLANLAEATLSDRSPS